VKTKFATLTDVARAAGMSRAQVSRALRGDPGVKETTREHVASVAANLDYRPNLAARNLVSAQTSTVGVVIGEPYNPFHIQLATSIDHALAEAGLDPVLSLRALDDASTLREAERFINLRAVGAILIGTPRDPQAIQAMAQKLPCVYLGKSVDYKNVSTIDIDDEAATVEAVRYLVGLGHRRIAHLAGSDEISAKERTAAYTAAMEEAGLKPNIVYGSHDAMSGHRGVDALMKGTRAPTAIFASNDAIAIGAIGRLRGIGLRVPQDVSVIGIDDIPAASDAAFSLTTMRQDSGEQARLAVQALEMMTANTKRHTTKLVLSMKMVVRESVAPPK
jgi:DNA-binding LacI/PurR family transcriptional regulator